MRGLFVSSPFTRWLWPNWLGAGLAVAAVLLLVPSRLSSQTLSEMTGTVTDATGAVVLNAKVTVTNDATGVSKTALTGASGGFQVTDLIPGIYTVKAELSGFQAAVYTGIGVEVGRIATVNPVLQPGNTSQSVEVQANLITLDTEQPQQGTTLEPALEAAIPFDNLTIASRGRQIDQYIFLAPGVTGSTFSHRIDGGVDFQNEVLFNGVVAIQSETQGYQTNINPPFEMVNQFRVLRDTFSAQYGLAQGAVNYQFTPGTNTFHGDGFEILRNNFFDAAGISNGGVTPVDREHNYGFSIGGPIFKNKMFFHVSSEWYRNNATQLAQMTVPSAAEKTGDFSGYTDTSGNQIPIYVPQFATATTAGWTPPPGCPIIASQAGQQFPGNVIPQSCFSPLAKSIVPKIPDPTLPGQVNNLTSQITASPYRQTSWGYTVDDNITDNQSIHFSEWRDTDNSIAVDNNAYFAVGNPLSGAKTEPRIGTGLFLTYSNTITPHLVVTLGGGWMGEINDEYNAQLGSNFAFAGVAGSSNLPRIEFTNSPINVNNFGAGNGGETFSINRKLGLSLDNNYLWVIGRHTLNIGIEFRRAFQDDHECQRCGGDFQFSGLSTANPATLSAGTTGSSFASFLLGDADEALRYFSPELKLRNFDASPYIQDDFKMTPRLTLNLGLRWDIMVPFNEESNNFAYFDPKISNPAAGGLLGAITKFGNCSGCAGITRAPINWKHFGRRLGFAYELTNKMVLQGGFSVNFLNGGTYEFGTNKVAVNYGNVLNGTFNCPSLSSNIPCYGTWDTRILPQLGAIPFTPGIGVGSTVFAFDPNDSRLSPYLLAWNIGIQREMPFNSFLTVSYVANRANRLPSALNPINQLGNQYLSLGSLLGQPYATAGPAAGIPLPYPQFLVQQPGASVLQALRPFPQYSDIQNDFDYNGSSFYNSLQMQYEKTIFSGSQFPRDIYLFAHDVGHELRLHGVCRQAVGQEQSEGRVDGRQ
ncbi:MAG: TonB-dependent receptor [Acidobacteriaceae bacterium]|nr:TonB-dependent receptor [Acidobacteriaceae bacterium]